MLTVFVTARSARPSGTATFAVLVSLPGTGSGVGDETAVVFAIGTGFG